MERKDIIDTNFKYIEGNENMDIDDYEWIINMKKKLIEKKEDKIIYDEINKCYRKIIEILSNEEDEDVKKYVDELQKFIVDYENKFLKKNNLNYFLIAKILNDIYLKYIF